MKGIKEKYILLGNLKINYRIAGDGPAVLILHGWGASSASWLKVQEILAKAGFKVLVPDFPGFGKSDSPQEPWSVTDYMRWTNEFTELLRLKKFFLLGHSFGGRVAIRFAVDFPIKLEKLILCSAAGIKMQPNLKRRLAGELSNLSKSLPPDIRNKFKDAFLRNTDYFKASGVMKETMKNVIAKDLEPYLSGIRTQTLIVWGSDDKMVPIRYAHIFRDKIKNSSLEIMPKIGHSPHLQNPEELADIILKFLSS